jgi:hypothetical protein
MGNKIGLVGIKPGLVPEKSTVFGAGISTL